MSTPALEAKMTFMAALLPDALNYLDLHELLRLMAVCRQWHQAVVNHPTYYGQLSLHDCQTSGWISLFLVRLDRSGKRPVNVSVTVATVMHQDVLTKIAEHFDHIRRLWLNPSSASLFAPALDLVRNSAPILESLSLVFDTEPPQRRLPCLPEDLLDGYAPCLRDAHLAGIAITCDFPPALRTVTHLSICNFDPRVLVVPNIFEQCTKLDIIDIWGNVALSHEAGQLTDFWTHISELGFTGDGFSSWRTWMPAIAHITDVSASWVDSDCVMSLADSLCGPLSLSLSCPTAYFPLTMECGEPPTLYTAEISSMPRHGDYLRKIEGNLPHPELEENSIEAFSSSPALAGRIVGLSISLDDWEIFVSPGHISPLPALETLELNLGADPAPNLGSLAPLVCPCLRQLTIAGPTTRRLPVLNFGQVAGFALNSLPETRRPLELVLKNVTIRQSEEDVSHIVRVLITA